MAAILAMFTHSKYWNNYEVVYHRNANGELINPTLRSRTYVQNKRKTSWKQEGDGLRLDSILQIATVLQYISNKENKSDIILTHQKLSRDLYWNNFNELFTSKDEENAKPLLLIPHTILMLWNENFQI